MSAIDGPASSTVTDHLFTPPVDRPWARCCVCSLSEAAHLKTGAEYVVVAPFRCPYCVFIGIDPCPHGRRDALDLKGRRLDPEPDPPVPSAAWCGTPKLLEAERRQREQGGGL